MDSNLYADLTSLEDVNEMEIRLNKRLNRLFSFNPPRDMEGKPLNQLSFIDAKGYETTEESFNNRWKQPDNWYILDEIAPTHFKAVDLTIKIPTLLFLNEELKRYVNNELTIEGESLAKQAKSPDSLRKELLSIRERIDPARSYLVRELVKIKKPLIDYIEKRWVHVEVYDPHYKENPSWDMVELLDGVERAYRGVMCGSVFAYEYLIGEYIDRERIGKLWKGTEAILKETKEYLKYQVALERYKQPGAPELSLEQKGIIRDLLKELSKELKGTDKQNEHVIRLFKTKGKAPAFKGKLEPLDSGKPPALFKRNGKPYKNRIGELLSEYCSVRFKNVSITGDSLKRAFDKEIEALGE